MGVSKPMRVAHNCKRVLDALGIEVHIAAAMPEDLRKRILAALPSAKDIATERWSDEDE